MDFYDDNTLWVPSTSGAWYYAQTPTLFGIPK